MTDMLLDSDIAEIIPTLPRLDLSDVAAARAADAEMLAQALASSGPVVDERVAVTEEAVADVPIRIYAPEKREGLAPGLVYFHGGAFVLGDLESEHGRLLRYTRDVGCITVSVDYRLAPEHAFPAGVEDCYAGLVWAVEHAAELGLDPSRVAGGGASAGGALAAAVSLLVRDRGGPSLAFQLLIYPVIDDRMETASMQDFVETPAWNRPQNELMWRHYLGAERSEVSPYAAPARAEELTGLPPAYVMTAEYDPLRDEGIEYALRLVQAGVTTELHMFPGTIHGFDLVAPNAGASQRAVDEQVSVLRRALCC